MARDLKCEWTRTQKLKILPFIVDCSVQGNKLLTLFKERQSVCQGRCQNQSELLQCRFSYKIFGQYKEKCFPVCPIPNSFAAFDLKNPLAIWFVGRNFHFSQRMLHITVFCLLILTALTMSAPRQRDIFEKSHVLQIEKGIEVLNSNFNAEHLTEAPYLHFTKTPKAVEIAVGNELVLKCEAIGIPPPIIEWFLLFHLLTKSLAIQFLKIKVELTVLTLLLSDFAPAAISETFTDTNYGGTSSSSGSSFSKLRLKAYNGNVIHAIDESNAAEKLHNAGLNTIQYGVTASKMVVPCIKTKDTAEYKCLASNGHQKLEKEKAKCWHKHSPPVISMWTDGRFERSGATVQLFCRVNGTPQSNITWYNEENCKLDNVKKYKILSNGDLVIYDTQWEDLGVYTCIASNEYGQDRIMAFFYPTEP
uniref:Ig-like domain-containing protein n=1 Tax=Wuchereria bancrofti TaxID=6293 RepID=A0A1I8E9V7_WUCBA